MEKVAKNYDVGVIVGRFQTHKLHKVHKELISDVGYAHPKTIIFLGVSPVPGSSSNPLDFESRKQMILEFAPKANVLYIKDRSSNEVWSKVLDEQIKDLTSPGQTAILYGGRELIYITTKYRHEIL